MCRSKYKCVAIILYDAQQQTATKTAYKTTRFYFVVCFSKTNRKNTKNVCLKLTLWKISEVKMFEITLEKNLNTEGKKDVYKDLK